MGPRIRLLTVTLFLLSIGIIPTASGLETSPSGDPARADKRAQDTEDGHHTDEASEWSTTGWYVGGGFGSSDDKGRDAEDDGFKILGGYRVNRYLALEAALVALGEFGPGEAFSKDGLSLEVLGLLPIGRRFELLAKGGAFLWSITDTRFCYGYYCDTVDDGVDLTYGAGFQVRLTQKFSGRLEWQRFTDVGQGDVDLLSLNVIYGF